MSTYGASHALAELLDTLADRLRETAAELRDLGDEPDDDERRRRLAAERQRRYRARQAADAAPRYPRDVTVTRARDARNVTGSTNSQLDGGPSRSTDPREVGRRDDERAEGVTSHSDARNARNDDNPGNPWAVELPTDDERETAQARIRELRDDLKRRRSP